MPEIMPLEEVKSGMTGKAYTIIDNSGIIETFDVDIVGLMDNGKGSEKMIMAKASGNVVQKTGGVLQGMSGSPVYVNGKLVGALATGLKEMSPYTFFIRPIESMLKLWNLPDEKAINKYVQNAKKSEEVAEEKNSDELAAEKAESAEEEFVAANTTETVEVDENKIEEKSALFFSGFDVGGSNFLKRELAPLGWNNLFASNSAGSGKTILYNAKVEPGSAIGVAVVCGDFLVGATGTVTAVDGKKILAFGHPFTHAGNVNFFMTDANVIGSISGTSGIGIKVSGVGNIIGRVNQDREAGIAGIIGSFPSVVPISVTVKDNSLDKTETFDASIAYNENLVPKLGAAIAYSALSKTADSLAESTVTVDFGIKTNAVADGNLSRQNMYYNATDVGQVAVIELLQALNLVCSNTTEESNIFGIDVNISLDNSRKTASLVSAVPDKVKVKPGETVNLKVTLQPYRKEVETITVPYTVPITRQPGIMTLDIHGGALVPVAQALASAGGIVTPSNDPPAKNYEEKIKTFLNSGRNNQIVVEPGASNTVKTDKQIKEDIKRAKKMQTQLEKSGKKPTPANNKVDTGYIIDNVIQATIQVDKI